MIPSSRPRHIHVTVIRDRSSSIAIQHHNPGILLVAPAVAVFDAAAEKTIMPPAAPPWHAGRGLEAFRARCNEVSTPLW